MSRWTVVLFLGFLSTSLPAQQELLRGRVVDKTRNRPVADQKVDLVSVRQGMQTVHSWVTNSQGKFSLPAEELDPDGVYLLHLFYQNIRYDQPVNLQAGQGSEIEMEVFQTTDALDSIRVRRAQILLRAQGEKLRVQQAYEVDNVSQPPKTFLSSAGTFRIRIPSAHQAPVITATGLLNLPIPQSAEPTGKTGEYRIHYPLKPGPTVVHVSYDADYASARYALRDSIPYAIEQAEVLISPADLVVSSRVLKSAGMDAGSGLARWEGKNLKPDSALELDLEGAAAMAAASEQGSDDGEIQRVPNAVGRFRVPLFLSLLLVLVGAAALALRRSGSLGRGE